MSDGPRRKWAKAQILREHLLPPGEFPTSAQIRNYLAKHPYPGGAPFASPSARARGGPRIRSFQSSTGAPAPPGAPSRDASGEKNTFVPKIEPFKGPVESPTSHFRRTGNALVAGRVACDCERGRDHS